MRRAALIIWLVVTAPAGAQAEPPPYELGGARLYESQASVVKRLGAPDRRVVVRLGRQMFGPALRLDYDDRRLQVYVALPCRRDARRPGCKRHVVRIRTTRADARSPEGVAVGAAADGMAFQGDCLREGPRRRLLCPYAGTSAARLWVELVQGRVRALVPRPDPPRPVD